MGTSTNCSAFCGAMSKHDRMKLRSWALRWPAWGCGNRGAGTPPPAGPPCGTGISRICTKGTTSAMCSTVRSWTRSCGPCGSARLAGRTPFSASSSSNNWKNAWGGGGSCHHGGKVHEAHPGLHEHQLESEKKMNLAQSENLEDLHQKRECQRSAPKEALLNSVLGENLEDQQIALHDKELECRRSAP